MHNLTWGSATGTEHFQGFNSMNGIIPIKFSHYFMDESIIDACWAPTNNVLHESLDAVKSWQGLARAFPVSKMFVGASLLASQQCAASNPIYSEK